MAKVHGFKAMFTCCVSLLTLVSDRCIAKHCEENKDKYVWLSLTSCVTCTTSFNLWMFCGGHDTFAMVVILITIYGSPHMSQCEFLRCITQQLQPWQTK